MLWGVPGIAADDKEVNDIVSEQLLSIRMVYALKADALLGYFLFMPDVLYSYYKDMHSEFGFYLTLNIL